jgi:ferredoxin
MAAARQICIELGLPSERYLQESFDFAELTNVLPASAERTSIPEIDNDAVPTFIVTFAKQNREISVRADSYVLAAARGAGVRLPSSCATGLCGTCKSKLLSGQVEMTHQGGIRQREVDAGMFLPCCSKPLSNLIVDR